MWPISLAKDKPSLEGLFGPLTTETDHALRDIFSEVDRVVLHLAEHFGGVRAGWERTGLELDSHGIHDGKERFAVGSFVEPQLNGEEGKCVSFSLELWSGGQYMGDSNEGWSLQAEVYADCQESAHCGHMHPVWECIPPRQHAPLDAATALLALSRQLSRLARDSPLEHWLSLAGDDGGSEEAEAE